MLATIFLWVIAGFIALAFLETTIEGRYGGAVKTKGWSKKIFGYKIREYHFWLWYVAVPIFVFSPLIATGWSEKLFGTLAVAYLLGGVIEDFIYFLVNPYYGLKKWNSRNAKWMSWFKIGKIEIPKFYVRNIIAAIIAWLIFVR